MPRGPLVDRAQHPRPDPGERVELLHWSVRAVGDERARVPERAERVRAIDAIGPEALGEIAIRGCVAELDGARDADLGKAAHVFGGETLCVLDAMPQPERGPHVARRLEGVERLAVRAVSDRVHSDGPPGAGAGPDDLRELLAARDHDAGTVEHPCGLGSRAFRP